MPASAFFRAVPGHAGDIAVLLEDLDDVELVLREDLREPVGRLDGLVLPPSEGPLGEQGRVQDVRAQAHLGGDLLADGDLVPRDHLHLDPQRPRLGDGGLGILPGRIGQGQHAKEPPGARRVGAGHAQGTEAPGREGVHRRFDFSALAFRLGDEGQDHLRCALADLEGSSLATLQGRFGALADRIEGLEMDDLELIQGLVPFEPEADGLVDGVGGVGPRSQGGGEDHLVRRGPGQAEGLAQGQPVLGEGSGLVGAEHVHAGQFLDGHQAAHHGLLFRQEPGAHGHGHRQHRRHGHGDGRHGEHQGELERGGELVAAEQGHGDDQHYEDDGEDDQVVPDLQHGLLEMADGVGRCHELGGLAEKGRLAGGGDHRVQLSAFENGARIDGLSGAAGDGQGFPGERRLVHVHGIALQELGIRRHDVPQAQAHEVAGHQVPGGEIKPGSAPLDPGLQGQVRLERGDGVAGLVLLPEPHHRVGQEQHEDDHEIRPVPDQPREEGRDLDHPGNRSPEMGEELQEGVPLRFGKLIGADLREELLGLLRAEAMGTGSALGQNGRHGAS